MRKKNDFYKQALIFISLVKQNIKFMEKNIFEICEIDTNSHQNIREITGYCMNNLHPKTHKKLHECKKCNNFMCHFCIKSDKSCCVLCNEMKKPAKICEMCDNETYMYLCCECGNYFVYCGYFCEKYDANHLILGGISCGACCKSNKCNKK